MFGKKCWIQNKLKVKEFLCLGSKDWNKCHWGISYLLRELQQNKRKYEVMMILTRL